MTARLDAGKRTSYSTIEFYQRACQLEEEDSDVALKVFFQVALSGFKPAQSKLVRDYPLRTRKLCQSKVDDAIALLMLGRICRYAGDDKQAFNHFRKAAKKGNRDAIFYVGDAYSRGKGVQLNLHRSVKYFTIAKDRGDFIAMGNLGNIYTTKNEYLDIPLGLQYLSKAADEGDQNAQWNLANIYLNGEIAPKNVQLALSLLQKSGGNGIAEAFRLIAQCYQSARVVEKDEVKALEYHEKAYRAGCDASLTSLAMLYLKGSDIVKNVPLGMECLQFASDRGHKEGLFKLGMVHFEGEFVPQNLLLAISLWDRAAADGHKRAQRKLAIIGDKRYKVR